MRQGQRNFIVRKAGQYNVGPWVVRARSPRGAFRVVRNGWPHWLTNHLRQETHVLECEGVQSDRRGRVLSRAA